MWLIIKEKELIEKDEEIKRQIAVNKEMDKIIGEKNEEIRELRNRVAELEDKDWYELCIKQLKEQNNKLIKERDELAFEKPLRTQIAELKQQLAEKDKVLTIYKQALELACFNVDCMYCSNFECRKEPYNEKHNCIECGELGSTQKHLSKYFLDLAKEKLEKGEE